ncbi:TPA: phage protein NinX family protein [Morganella morganii]
MNKYRDKSDLEINKAVFRAARIKHKWFKFLPHGVVTYNIKGDWVIFDPCNNPADAMPIVIENNIDLLNGDNQMPELFGHHSAYTLFNFSRPIASDSLKERKTIYRLAMEVFLMMKDAENETNT